MAISEPKLVQRDAQPYVAIKIETPIRSMAGAANKAMAKLEKWMTKKGITPSGAPFWRYLVINMEGVMHLEVGFPTASLAAGDETVLAGTLPEGTYVTTVNTGSWKGKGLYFATRDLLAWASQQNIEWDRHDVPEGDAWASRLEIYLTDPDEEPDPQKYQTELAFKVK